MDQFLCVSLFPYPMLVQWTCAIPTVVLEMSVCAVDMFADEETREARACTSIY